MKILVVYYSRYGHILKMAQAVGKGVQEVSGTELVMRRVAEFAEVEKQIPEDQYALATWNEHKDLPVCTLEDLRSADGILFG